MPLKPAECEDEPNPAGHDLDKPDGLLGQTPISVDEEDWAPGLDLKELVLTFALLVVVIGLVGITAYALVGRS